MDCILRYVDPYPPPNDVIISELAIMDDLSIQVTFEWSAVVTNYCSTLLYIITSNCGLCPNSTSTTDTTVHVTCAKVLIGQLCTLSVHTSVCESFVTEGNATSIAATFDGKMPVFKCMLAFQYWMD